MEVKVFEKELEYCGKKVKLFLGKYIYPENNGLFMETLDGEPHCTCSINIEYNGTLDEDLVFIKDYSENEGMTKFLFENGVISEIIGYQPSGYILAPIARLCLDKFIEVEED